MCEVSKDPQLLRHSCFRDESIFIFLNGDINAQNVRLWCDPNPRIFKMKKAQRIQKMNVWAGILWENIIGPLFYRENL